VVDLAQSIQDLGLAGIIVLIALVAIVGLARQWWVPGWLYRQEREGRIVSDTQAVRNAEALEKLARAVTGEHPARKRHEAGDDPG
jgi:hypothetical protein